MDPIQYQSLQEQINDSIDKLVELREDLHKLYLKLGPVKETVRLLEKEKTKAKKYKKKNLAEMINQSGEQTDSHLQDVEKIPEDK